MSLWATAGRSFVVNFVAVTRWLAGWRAGSAGWVGWPCWLLGFAGLAAIDVKIDRFGPKPIDLDIDRSQFSCFCRRCLVSLSLLVVIRVLVLMYEYSWYLVLVV